MHPDKQSTYNLKPNILNGHFWSYVLSNLKRSKCHACKLFLIACVWKQLPDITSGHGMQFWHKAFLYSLFLLKLKVPCNLIIKLFSSGGILHHSPSKRFAKLNFAKYTCITALWMMAVVVKQLHIPSFL